MMDDTIIYKLGAIEAQVKGLSENIVTAVLRLEQRIGEVGARFEEDHKALEKKLAKAESDIKFLLDWRNNLFTKMGFLVSGVSVFWLVFGKNVETMVATIF